MSDCDDYLVLLHGLIDGELDAANTLRCESHLQQCKDCASAFHNAQTMRAALQKAAPRYAAPDRARRRLQTLLKSHAGTYAGRSLSWRLFRPFVAKWSLTFTPVLALALLVAIMVPRGADLPDQIIASHVRSLQGGHLIDVVSSDRHTVKPWFAGRIDYVPPVVDLSAAGFPLVGGRLDYVDSQPVAVMIYRRGHHIINLYVWPVHGGVRPLAADLIQRSGFTMLHRTRAGMNFWCVSDAGVPEMHAFQAALSSALAKM